MLSELLLPLLLAAAPVEVTRGPYLQQATPTSVIVRWRSAQPTDSVVSYARLLSVPFPRSVSLPAPTLDHEVLLSGLQPAARYYYGFGSGPGTPTLQASQFFVTPPTAGTPARTRVWVLGDSGTASASARAVRDAYANYAAGRYTDVWLMLGDNAYPSGSDSEYQAAVFDMYPQFLQQTALWPTLGNHDTAQATSVGLKLPYFRIFSLPGGAQAGGVASGTEAYYSFDHANIHFVCLDSMTSARTPGSAMLTWLAEDLAQTTADWLVAFWHHPPYSRGSHNSDNEIELVEMRQHVLPLLEAHGVDLVLSGHSHAYERSFLLDGHYGPSGTLTHGMIRDHGDGRPSGAGAYAKPAGPQAPNAGAVYAVAGSSGQVSAVALHPAMYVALSQLGSLVIDVYDQRLDARFLSSAGVLDDEFTILKSAQASPAR